MEIWIQASGERLSQLRDATRDVGSKYYALDRNARWSEIPLAGASRACHIPSWKKAGADIVMAYNQDGLSPRPCLPEVNLTSHAILVDVDNTGKAWTYARHLPTASLSAVTQAPIRSSSVHHGPHDLHIRIHRAGSLELPT